MIQVATSSGKRSNMPGIAPTCVKSKFCRSSSFYLDKYDPEENRPAAEVFAEFLEYETLDEALINQSRTQRIIMVAANFRKEVTNTALWLMQFGLRVQCCF